MTLQLNEAGDAIEDVKFDGVGCKIAMASADPWQMPYGAVNEALSMVQRFQSMMKGQDEFPELRKLNVMAGLQFLYGSKQPGTPKSCFGITQ